jgi:hypothetical protein
MKNAELNIIADATNLALDFYKSEGIYEDRLDVWKRAFNWFSKKNISDVETLAALAISGDYEYGMTTDEIKDIREFYFPSMENIEPPADFGIAEIEMAQHDAQWW